VLAGDVIVRRDGPIDPSAVRFEDLLDSFALIHHNTPSTHRLGGNLDVVGSDDTPSTLKACSIGISDRHLITWPVNMRRTSTANCA